MPYSANLEYLNYFAALEIVPIFGPLYCFIVSTLLRGEELYTQMGFFCSVNFRRSIYSLWRFETGIIRKLLQRRIWS